MSEETSAELVPIDDLNVFAEALIIWHERQVAALHQLVDVPDGIEMVIGDDEDDSIILTGDALIAFRAGLGLALDYLGVLPFTDIEEESSESTGD